MGVINREHHIYCFFKAEFKSCFTIEIPLLGSIFKGLASNVNTIGLNIQYHINNNWSSWVATYM